MNQGLSPVVGRARSHFPLTRRMRASVRTMRWVLGICSLLLLPLFPGKAQDLTATVWTNPSTASWGDAVNWSAGLPDSTFAVEIANSGTPVVSSGIDAVANGVNLGTPDSAGNLSVQGGSLTIVDDFHLGVTGSAFFTQTGGAVSNKRGFLGFGAGARATISGGTWTNSNGLYIETAELIIEGTGQVISSLVQLEYSFRHPPGRIVLAGGTLTTGVLEAVVSGGRPGPLPTLRFDGGRLKLSQDQATLFRGIDVDFAAGGGTIDTQGFDVTSDVQLRGSTFTGTKAGSGTLTLGGTISNPAGSLKEMVVSEGQLRMNRTEPTDMHVLSGASLAGNGGTGAITLESGAFLAPGNSLGTLTGASLLWQAGAVLQFELGAGASDFLSLSGTLSKGGTGAHAFQFLDDGWQVGTTYDLIGFGGTDFQASDFTFSNGNGFDGNFTLNGSRLKFTVVSVPEPSAWALVTAGMLLGIVAARKMRFARPRS